MRRAGSTTRIKGDIYDQQTTGQAYDQTGYLRKEKGKQLQDAESYFRGDYIGIRLIKNFFRMTAAFLLGAGLWILANLDYVVERLGVLDVAGIGWKLLAAWAVLEAVYLLLTYLVSTLRYARCEKEREEYGQLLLSLEREYSREGRRIDRVRKPEEDRR